MCSIKFWRCCMVSILVAPLGRHRCFPTPTARQLQGFTGFECPVHGPLVAAGANPHRQPCLIFVLSTVRCDEPAREADPSLRSTDGFWGEGKRVG
jgi:hypothetical protein